MAWIINHIAECNIPNNKTKENTFIYSFKEINNILKTNNIISFKYLDIEDIDSYDISITDILK